MGGRLVVCVLGCQYAYNIRRVTVNDNGLFGLVMIVLMGLVLFMAWSIKSAERHEYAHNVACASIGAKVAYVDRARLCELPDGALRRVPGY